jgi:hypothetical protein
MIVERIDPRTKDKTYGIEGVTVDGSFQLYPYETKSEALKNQRLIDLQNNPKDPRFKDPIFESTLKALDRI